MENANPADEEEAAKNKEAELCARDVLDLDLSPDNVFANTLKLVRFWISYWETLNDCGKYVNKNGREDQGTGKRSHCGHKQAV